MTAGTPPVPGFDDAFFWEGTARRRLLAQRCSSCGSLQHPPLPVCSTCQSFAFDHVELTGRGILYSWIVAAHSSGNDAEEGSKLVGLVQLDEGVRILAALRDVDVNTVVNDMPLAVVFVDKGAYVAPEFQPTVPDHVDLPR
jgi:uncharacterized protein